MVYKINPYSPDCVLPWPSITLIYFIRDQVDTMYCRPSPAQNRRDSYIWHQRASQRVRPIPKMACVLVSWSSIAFRDLITKITRIL